MIFGEFGLRMFFAAYEWSILYIVHEMNLIDPTCNQPTDRTAAASLGVAAASMGPGQKS